MTDLRSTARYLDPSLATAERVEDLLQRMSLEEKLAQMGSIWVFSLLDGSRLDGAKADEYLAQGIGHITRVAGASNLDPQGVATLANAIQSYLVNETRLGIPAIVHEETTAGYMARGATEFPQNIGLAATWEPDIARRIGRRISSEMRAAGAHQALAPVLDVGRDPRWGRIEETFGEDPGLVSAFGVAMIEGLQDGETPVVATAKHFAGHGAPEGGMNSAPPHYGHREFREVHLAPFEAAVSAGVGSVMHAYHEVDGVPALASRELLVETLRRQWGFEGTVVSDYNGIEELVESHGISGNLSEAAALALDAGLDVELPRTAGYATPLVDALDRGDVTLEQVDDAVRRTLADKFRLGLFEKPYVPAGGMASIASQDPGVAIEAAAKSLVLVKNDADLLPLGPTTHVAVIGPNADSGRNLLGDYSYPAHIELLRENQERGEAFLQPIPATFDDVPADDGVQTILDAIKAKAASVTYAHGGDVNTDDRSGFSAAVAAATAADVAVVVVGGKSGLTDDCTCGEARDRMTLGLPGVQEDLVREIHATGTPIVLVLVGGRPLAVPWAAESVPAILYAWLPGTEGAEAIASVLFGDVSPSGRLPITVPRHVGQVPIYYGHKASGGASRWKTSYVDGSNEPLWAFGHGMTYSTVEYRLLRVEASRVGTDGVITAELTVANTGDVDVAEVVQIYGSLKGVSVTRPVKQLLAFHRLPLAAGEEATVRATIPVELLAFYDRAHKRSVEPGQLRLLAGPSSASTPLVADISIEGPAVQIGKRDSFSSTTTEL